MTVGESVLIRYMHPNYGKHMCRGPATKQNYGYRGRGDEFKVFKEDIRARPDLFVPVASFEPPAPVAVAAAERAPVLPPPPPRPIDLKKKEEPIITLSNYKIADLDFGPSLNKRHRKALVDARVITLQDAVDRGHDGLVDIKGIGDRVAETLLYMAKKYST